MMFVVDTNILIYAADKRSDFHPLCSNLVEKWKERLDPWHLTWGICYEFLRVSTHPKVFRNPWKVTDSWSFLEALQASPGFSMLVETDRHSQLFAQSIQDQPHLRANLLHDFHTAVLMKEHGIRWIYTRVIAFRRFSSIEPIDPITAQGNINDS